MLSNYYLTQNGFNIVRSEHDAFKKWGLAIENNNQNNERIELSSERGDSQLPQTNNSSVRDEIEQSKYKDIPSPKEMDEVKDGK